MKKVLFLSLLAALIVSLFAIPVLATPPAPNYAYVTIVDANKNVALASEKVTLGDADTIDDILRRAHAEFYKGGADAGYASEETPWGISMVKLWGDESGSYGYYVNDASSMNLTDKVKPGDHIYVFVYTDTMNFSDTYCYFNNTQVYAEKGDIATLTLTKSSYDENWNSVIEPVAGATITINGEKTDLVTNEKGEVAIMYNQAGELLVSAVHDELNLTPPVLVATVEGDGNPTLIVLIVAIVLVVSVSAVVIVKKKR